MPRPIAVTGMGAITPIGRDAESFWAGVTTGANGIREVTRFDTTGFMSSRAGEIPPVPAPLSAPAPAPRSARYLSDAIGMALADAGLANTGTMTIGVCVGTVYGARPDGERTWDSATPRAGWLDPFALVAPAVHEHRLNGPVRTIPTACAAGNHAIGMAADLLRTERADVMIAAGVEELSFASFAIFTALRSMAADVPRPFDRDRRGLVLGEGAGVLVLERQSHALARGAHMHGLLMGHSATDDAYHLSAPHPDGAALDTAIRQTLESSRVAADEVSYVSAHGTGTRANDTVEAAVLGRIFGDHPAVSSIKGMTGHTGGAAGTLGAITCLLAMRDGIVPGNPTLEEPEEEFAVVDLVRGLSREQKVRYALNNAIGFGGGVATTLFGAVP